MAGDWQLKDRKSCPGSIKSFFATLRAADFAEKYVEMFVAQEGLTTDEHEALVRIVRMMLIPLASISS